MKKKWIFLALLIIVALILSLSTIDCKKENGNLISVAPNGSETTNPSNNQILFNKHIILAYFPSWSENYTSSGQGSKLRDIPSFINCIFLSFGKPDITYMKGSYDIANTGIQVPYDGCTFKESIAALKKKGIIVLLSIGGETYTNWGRFNVQALKDFLDDFGFDGFDFDYEPSDIGSSTANNVEIDLIKQARAIMPKGKYIISCAPFGVGALGGLTNDDPQSPYRYANRFTITGQTLDNNNPSETSGIHLFGFSSTGHMIPVFNAVGDQLDMVAFQGYNIGGSSPKSLQLLYDSYSYYATLKGFIVAAGIDVPPEPWGPYYNYTPQSTADLSSYIVNGGIQKRNSAKDGIMLWQVLQTSNIDKTTGYEFLNVADKVLNGGASPATAVANKSEWKHEPYMGGAEQMCGGGGGTGEKYCGIFLYDHSKEYPTSNTKVIYKGYIWHNAWWTGKNEYPGLNAGQWVKEGPCAEAPPDKP